MEVEVYDISNTGRQIRKLIEKKSEHIMEKYGLRMIEIDILVMLHKAKNIDTAKKIIDKKHISKAHVSKSIDNLKRLGFIELLDDEEDRRITHITLSEKADEVVKEEVAVYRKCRELMFSGVTEYEREIVKDVLAKMAGNLAAELEREE